MAGASVVCFHNYAHPVNNGYHNKNLAGVMKTRGVSTAKQ